MKKLLMLLLALMPFAAHAAGDAELYDPQLPADSAFIRVVNATPSPAANVSVAGLSLGEIAAPGASDYQVIKQGGHKLSVGGKESDLTIAAGKYYTVALLPGGKQEVLEDASIVNPTKSAVYFYNLSDAAASLHAPDFKADIASDVASGKSNMREVNAVEIGLTAQVDGKEVATFEKTTLKRRAGFSFILTGSSGAYKTLAVENTIKRN